MILNENQPEILTIDDRLRLRRFDDQFEFALPWYQDAETNYMVDGQSDPYDLERLARMYHYLDQKGELYFIEVWEKGVFRPIGDVTFWQDDMPIVIGVKEYRGKGIGRKVIAALIARGRELGYACLRIGEIYDWNTASRRCFESLGFRPYKRTEKGAAFQLELK